MFTDISSQSNYVEVSDYTTNTSSDTLPSTQSYTSSSLRSDETSSDVTSSDVTSSDVTSSDMISQSGRRRRSSRKRSRRRSRKRSRRRSRKRSSRRSRRRSRKHTRRCGRRHGRRHYNRQATVALRRTRQIIAYIKKLARRRARRCRKRRPRRYIRRCARRLRSSYRRGRRIVRDSSTSQAGKVWDWFKDKVTKLHNTVKSIVKGIANAVTGKVKIRQGVINLARELPALFKDVASWKKNLKKVNFTSWTKMFQSMRTIFIKQFKARFYAMGSKTLDDILGTGNLRAMYKKGNLTSAAWKKNLSKKAIFQKLKDRIGARLKQKLKDGKTPEQVEHIRLCKLYLRQYRMHGTPIPPGYNL